MKLLKKKNLTVTHAKLQWEKYPPYLCFQQKDEMQHNKVNSNDIQGDYKLLYKKQTLITLLDYQCFWM